MRLIVPCVLLALIACDEGATTIVDAASQDGGADGNAGADATAVDAAPACAVLDQAACRATAGCVADFCDTCTCTPAFVGCRATGGTAAECPVLDCPAVPSCCSADGDCGGGICTTPDDPPGCGICRQAESTCATDNDCRATAVIGIGGTGLPICEPIACACTPATECVPGCANDTECSTGETCDVAAARCHPSACSAAAPCPPDFDCGASGCARRACTDDVACDGFCVEGLCRPALGECTQPPA